LLDQPRKLLLSSDTGSLEHLCAELMKERKEVSSLQFASQTVAKFAAKEPDQQIDFFRHHHGQSIANC